MLLFTFEVPDWSEVGELQWRGEQPAPQAGKTITGQKLTNEKELEQTCMVFDDYRIYACIVWCMIYVCMLYMNVELVLIYLIRVYILNRKQSLVC